VDDVGFAEAPALTGLENEPRLVADVLLPPAVTSDLHALARAALDVLDDLHRLDASTALDALVLPVPPNGYPVPADPYALLDDASFKA
jgi:hypothetical protein